MLLNFWFDARKMRLKVKDFVTPKNDLSPKTSNHSKVLADQAQFLRLLNSLGSAGDIQFLEKI